jgi:hypothetical protein
MKFLKTKNISKWTANDQTIITYPKQTDVAQPGNRVVMNATGGLMLPKGTSAQRPRLSGGIRQPTDANGTIRYNTTIPALEAYIGGAWVIVASPAASAIVKQTLGPGDGTETVFGPLNSTAAFVTAYSASADNIIVLVENVMQISTTNFSVQQSVSGSLTGPNSPYADGWYVKFTSAVPASGGGGNPVYITVYYGYAN